MRVTRQESKVDEEVLFDRELWITTFKFASTIAAHATTKDQILRACWRATWIGLDKAQALDRTSQRHGAKKRPRYRVFAKLCKGDRTPGPDIQPLTRANPFVSPWQPMSLFQLSRLAWKHASHEEALAISGGHKG